MRSMSCQRKADDYFVSVKNLFLSTDPVKIFRIYPQSPLLSTNSVVLAGMFSFKCASQFAERYGSDVTCAWNMEDPISNNFCKFSK
jgi:hypothetical protein